MNVVGKNYRVWDDVAKVPYLADALGKMYASYEDIESVNAKVEFLKSRNMLGAMIWEFREDNKEGTLRRAVKHAMDGNPDAPGKYERPDEWIPEKEAPKMGKVEFTKKLQTSDGKWIPELSGLCLSKDGDFLWGCDDNGGLYKINFDGTFSLHWDKSAEMEALAIDPATGTMYIGLESTSNSGYVVPAPGYNSKTNFDWLVDGASDMGNSGVEGIAWYKGEILLGTQTGATLFRYTLDGQLQEKKSLRTVCSNISEIAGLDYDEENDWLWVIDSNSNSEKPQYDPYTIYLFDGAATKLIAKYYIGDFADWNPEAICVDKKNGCIWVGEDCGDEQFSLLHKVKFSGL
jgi:sugar lactone lactonase YvrE